MNIKKPRSRDRQFLFLALVPAYFILVGFFLQSPGEILQGIFTIIREPDFLITDYFIIGGVGAAFVNAGILTLVSIGIVYGLGMDFDGHTITSACLMFGFSLFGKNLLNIWAIMLGVFMPGITEPQCPGIFILDIMGQAFPRLLHRSCRCGSCRFR